LKSDASLKIATPFKSLPVGTMPKKRPTIKKTLWSRDGGKCFYCECKLHDENKTVDHVIPKSKNGPSKVWNLVLSCYDCNARKGDCEPAGEHLQLVNKRKALHDYRVALGKKISLLKKTNNKERAIRLIGFQRIISESINKGLFPADLMILLKYEEQQLQAA